MPSDLLVDDEPTNQLDHDLVARYYEVLTCAAGLRAAQARARARRDVEATRVVTEALARQEATARTLRTLLTTRSRRRGEALHQSRAAQPLDAA